MRFIIALAGLAFLLPIKTLAHTGALMTPYISANALFDGRSSNFDRGNDAEERNGFDLREAEVQFYADVDPYSSLNMILTVHPEYSNDPVTNRLQEEWKVEPEELFANSNVVPDVTLKIGKFKAAFGKHNLLHDHVFPFIDAPKINTVLLGDEGLADVGLSAAYLIPISSWFSELTAQLIKGGPADPEFSSPSPANEIALLHWKNLADLSDSLTVEIGASYAQGGNAMASTTTLAGADLTFKWRPQDMGRFHSAVWGTEFISRRQGQVVDPGTPLEHSISDEDGAGVSTYLGYQFAERWTALARYESLRIDNSSAAAHPAGYDALANGTTQAGTAEIMFSATEFSVFRMDVSQSHGPARANGDTDERKIVVQANFTIGSHPAHSY